MTFRGYVSGQKGLTFPERWKYGPDNNKRIVNRWFLMARAQAKYRDEPWHLTFADYWNFWADHMHQRGKKATDLQLKRIDETQPWHRKNCVLLARGHNNRGDTNGSTT